MPHEDEQMRGDFLPCSNDDGSPMGFRHGTVNHSSGEYVRGDAHTNSVEVFWMLIKTGIRGRYCH